MSFLIKNISKNVKVNIFITGYEGHIIEDYDILYNGETKMYEMTKKEEKDEKTKCFETEELFYCLYNFYIKMKYDGAANTKWEKDEDLLDYEDFARLNINVKHQGMFILCRDFDSGDHDEFKNMITSLCNDLGDF